MFPGYSFRDPTVGTASSTLYMCSIFAFVGSEAHL